MKPTRFVSFASHFPCFQLLRLLCGAQGCDLGRLVLCSGVALFAVTLSAGAIAQAYPQKPVRIIVPTSPGPGPDQVARLLAPKMAGGLGQSVLVENRIGANGVIGSDVVARSAADGYTLLFTTPSTHITTVYLYKGLPYDPVKDFTPISIAVEPVTVMAVNVSVPANSVKEFIEYARRNPNKLAYGSSGVGSVFQMVGEMLKQATGIEMTHVPYKGVVLATGDLVGGQIAVAFIPMANALPQARGGKIRILAVLEGARFSGTPDIPTIGESIPGFEKPGSWFGYFGPAGLARPIVMRLHREIVSALNSPEVKPKLDEGAFAVIGNTPEEFAAMMKSGFEVYGKAIKAAGLKPE